MKQYFYFLAFLILLSSCSLNTFYYQTGSSPQNETNPNSIQIYSEDIDREYEVIGSIAVDVLGESNAALAYLKKQAAKHGADAVINVELTKMTSYVSRTGISGVAVKFK
jgi:hypothetical protein